jgi:hypothetical protein
VLRGGVRLRSDAAVGNVCSGCSGCFSSSCWLASGLGLLLGHCQTLNPNLGALRQQLLVGFCFWLWVSLNPNSDGFKAASAGCLLVSLVGVCCISWCWWWWCLRGVGVPAGAWYCS